jgi:hypothetical protein
MILSLLLLILSALPFLALGLLLVLAADNGAQVFDANQIQQLEAAGISPAEFVRILGAGIVAVAVVYLGFAVLAFRGLNWARIILTIMTAGFTLLALGTAFTGLATDTASLLFTLVVTVLSVAGTVILFMPEARRYFAAARH